MLDRNIVDELRLELTFDSIRKNINKRNFTQAQGGFEVIQQKLLSSSYKDLDAQIKNHLLSL